MSIVVCGSSALAVAMIFYSWRDYNERLLKQRQLIRERVAYMLWVMSHAALE